MRHDFEFDGRKLSDIGAVIAEKPSYVLSVRELDFTTIPGKSGDVVTDKKRFKNRTVSYKISSVPKYCDYDSRKFVYKLSEWLLTSYDYKILRDTYNRGYFFKGVCTGISNPSVEATGIVWTTVTFYCDPFLYSDSGQKIIAYTSVNTTLSKTLYNDEEWDSEPIIEVIPGGANAVSISINGDGISFEEFSQAVTIDVPNKNIYYTATKTPCNHIVSALKMPLLVPGENSISASGQTDYTLKITPNWRRL